MKNPRGYVDFVVLYPPLSGRLVCCCRKPFERNDLSVIQHEYE
ncbi:hypothetical protein QE436_000678 [Pantoea anthophila]|nr:hypothetical protein [Pantoea anthophila]